MIQAPVKTQPDSKRGPVDLDRVESLVEQLLIELGEDPHREGLLKTPRRVAQAMEFLTSGYRCDVEEIINGAVFEAEANNMILTRDIEVYSLCEHHMLPFFGRCHIAYIAEGKVLGVSKLARIVDYYSRRLQIQERLTSRIARRVMQAAGARGVGVILQCRHMCMMMRGVEKQNSFMTTSSVLGQFHDDPATRMEFMHLVQSGSAGI